MAPLVFNCFVFMEQAQQLNGLSLAIRTYYLSLGGGAKVLNIIWVDA
jgi:hypothetical protein